MYNTTSTTAVANRMANVASTSDIAQVMQLPTIPSTTMPTPSRWGKSLRTNRSVLGQTRQRRN